MFASGSHHANGLNRTGKGNCSDARWRDRGCVPICGFRVGLSLAHARSFGACACTQTARLPAILHAKPIGEPRAFGFSMVRVERSGGMPWRMRIRARSVRREGASVHGPAIRVCAYTHAGFGALTGYTDGAGSAGGRYTHTRGSAREPFDAHAYGRSYAFAHAEFGRLICCLPPTLWQAGALECVISATREAQPHANVSVGRHARA